MTALFAISFAEAEGSNQKIAGIGCAKVSEPQESAAAQQSQMLDVAALEKLTRMREQQSRIISVTIMIPEENG